MKAERKEALIRIPVTILGWIIMDLWAALITLLGLVHLFFALFTAKRHKGLASFSNYFVTYLYRFARYASFTTNSRPFPWADFGKEIEKIDMKKRGE